jgi:hypothetical protein
MASRTPKTSFTTTPRANNLTDTVYLPDNVISVLACTEQHQFCNPDRGPDDVSCTPLLPLGMLLYDSPYNNDTGYLDPIFDTDNQFTTANVIGYGALEAQLSIQAPSFNTPPLLADDLRDDILSPRLPDDQ